VISASDGVDGAGIPLLKSLCRADGMLLKPDKPARAVDAQWLGHVFNRSSQPSGVLWSTAVTLPGAANKSWGYVLSVNSVDDWSASAEELDLPGGEISTAGYSWARPPEMYAPGGIIELSEFSGAEKLSLPGQRGAGGGGYGA
jgi:hypothetical protein